MEIEVEKGNGLATGYSIISDIMRFCLIEKGQTNLSYFSHTYLVNRNMLESQMTRSCIIFYFITVAIATISNESKVDIENK